MDETTFSIPKSRIAARFGRASEAYEACADVQMEIVKRLADIMRREVGDGEQWCDFGSGSGMLLERLRIMPARVRFICLDLSLQPLRRVLLSHRTDLVINGDIDFLPIRPESFHGAASSSALQWVESPDNALSGIAQTLKPGGLFYFSIFVDGSFSELIELRSQMKLSSAIWLPTVSELLMTLDKAGFEVSPDDIENFYRMQLFTDSLSALGSLSSIGVTATGGRLLNRSELDTLCKNYTVTFSKDGMVPLTYRAVIGKVRKKT
jgi:malonyl-CoA O-methyltransferase